MTNKEKQLQEIEAQIKSLQAQAKAIKSEPDEKFNKIKAKFEGKFVWDKTLGSDCCIIYYIKKIHNPIDQTCESILADFTEYNIELEYDGIMPYLNEELYLHDVKVITKQEALDKINNMLEKRNKNITKMIANINKIKEN